MSEQEVSTGSSRPPAESLPPGVAALMVGVYPDAALTTSLMPKTIEVRARDRDSSAFRSPSCPPSLSPGSPCIAQVIVWMNMSLASHHPPSLCTWSLIGRHPSALWAVYPCSDGYCAAQGPIRAWQYPEVAASALAECYKWATTYELSSLDILCRAAFTMGTHKCHWAMEVKLPAA